MQLSFVLIAFTFVVAGAYLIAAITAAITFGGPKPPPAMASINNSFKPVDFSDLPPLFHFAAAEGASVAYRYNSPTRVVPRGSIVLVRGFSASSTNMHLFVKAGDAAYALNVRGNGESVPKGTIRYIGQLDTITTC